jgi:hypothetical protein
VTFADVRRMNVHDLATEPGRLRPGQPQPGKPVHIESNETERRNGVPGTRCRQSYHGHIVP